jgi:valyl-tRNA synthetase
LISTQVSRHDLGREKFLEHVWAWKGQYGSRICTQLRRLGSSVDWSRERFTMDDRCAKAVTEAFVRFHEAGIMYRASRLVNWSCALKSAISDLEVDHLELNGGELRTVPGHGSTKYQFAMFAEFAYKVVDSDEEVVVATTRLETMLGDVAVAVHPKDPRYKHLHGKKLRHPFFPSREVTVVTDDILVDMAKGTGCVKVTPAHDPHDYECGKRHSLPFMTIFSLDGRVVHQATPFSVTGQGDYPVEVFPSWIAGQMRYDARVLVEKKLDELGLLRGKSERPMTLAVCSRSGDIIEPLVQPQWFVDCSKPAKRACDAVRDGSLRIRPKMHERTWFKWRVPRRRSGPSTRPWRRRLQQTRSWLVSFSISRPFGPRRGRVDGVGATREPRRRRHAPRNAGSRT